MTKHADTTLNINLSAIADNYQKLCAKFKGGEVAAVVKADAYGLGVSKVLPSLKKAGCTKFFVANLDEALAVLSSLPRVRGRVGVGAESLCASPPPNLPPQAVGGTKGLLPQAVGGSRGGECFVFHGIRKGQEKIFRENKLIPCLNSKEQFEIWSKYAKKIGVRLPAVLHIDTGMNRLGVSYGEFAEFAENADFTMLDIKYVMSHLASADEKDSSKNPEQLERMRKVQAVFPKVPVSFVNSYGVFLGKEYHFDLARPGMALYGANPTPDCKNPMKNVVGLNAKILQIRSLQKFESVGYGATIRMKKGSRIATIPVGYADGYLRSLSNKGFCYFEKHKIPLVGRVSMDLIMLDVTNIPENKIKVGDEIEIIGNNVSVDDVANCAGTISYEVLTSLGQRYKRVYK